MSSPARPAIRQAIKLIPVMGATSIMRRTSARNIKRKAFRILRIAWNAMQMDVNTTIRKPDLGGIFHPGFYQVVGLTWRVRIIFPSYIYLFSNKRERVLCLVDTVLAGSDE